MDGQIIMSVDFQEVDFIVRDEDYSRYLLNDGTILKAKIVLKKILFSGVKTPEGYPAQTNFESLNAISAIVPPANKRPPSTEPFDPKQKGEEIQFQEQEIKKQEYMTSNGFRITISPVLSKVFKYNQTNMYGEPVYQVVLQNITNIDKIETTA